MLVYWSWKKSHGTIYGSCKAKKGGGSLRKNEKPSLFFTGKYRKISGLVYCKTVQVLATGYTTRSPFYGRNGETRCPMSQNMIHDAKVCVCVQKFLLSPCSKPLVVCLKIKVYTSFRWCNQTFTSKMVVSPFPTIKTWVVWSSRLFFRIFRSFWGWQGR